MSVTLVRERSRIQFPASVLGNETAIGVMVIFLAAVVVILALYFSGPPASVAVSAPLTEFSSARAAKRLETIASQPHPMGTTAHAAVREYIVAALAESGVNAEVQTTTTINQSRNGSIRAASINNIAARLAGTTPGKAVMFTGHYDTVPNSSGAADDGAAVAAMLETVRALKTGPQLKNDLIFLFTDGEESGLLGARAFVAEHPWAKDVAVVFNFEARGNSGPSIMFETSPGNNWLVDEFAEASPRPVANSLSYEIYRLMPNETDLVIFKDAGLAGMNFAFINGVSNYHARTDTVDEIDQDSIQHHGATALALARHFGNLDLKPVAKTNAVYFDVLGFFLVRYPTSWALPLAAVVTLAFIGIAFVGWRRGRLKLKGIALGVLALLLSAAASYVVVALGWWALLTFYTRYSSMPQWLRYGSDQYLVSFIALTLAVTSGLYIIFRRYATPESLMMGALVWWLILSIASAFYLPGASYLFAWPLLFNLLGVLVAVLVKDEARGRAATSAYLLAFAVPGLVLFAPLTQMIFTGLGPEWSAYLMVVVVLVLGLLVPHLSLLSDRRKWLVPAALLVAGVVVIAVSVSTARFSKDYPRQNHLFYKSNATTGQNVWVSFDNVTDSWTQQVLPAGSKRAPLTDLMPSGTAAFLQSDAPSAGLAPPEIAVLEDRTENDLRRFRLRVKSARLAQFLNLQLSANTQLYAVVVNGKRVDYGKAPVAVSEDKRWLLRYYAFPKEGVELSLEVKPSGPLQISVFDQSYGLPEVPGAQLRPRPDDLIPTPNAAYSDATVVSKVFTF